MLYQGFFTFQPGALLSLQGLVIGRFSCTNSSMMPPPFPSQHFLSSIGIQEVWAGQDFCFWTLVLGTHEERACSASSKKNLSVFYRARRYMREDSKTVMLCGVCLFHSLEIPWVHKAIFQEWGKSMALWTGTSVLKLLQRCSLAPSACQQSFLPSPLQFWIVSVAQKLQGIALLFFYSLA